MIDTTDSVQTATRGRAGAWCFALLVGTTYAFLWTMAQLEPVTGDGWFVVDGLRSSGYSVKKLIRGLIYAHNHSNARLGQLFTSLMYWPGWHVVVTPLVLTSLFFLIFAHALKRFPRPAMQDAYVWLVCVALTWLAMPSPGHAFFYRPITTNYLFTHTLVLLYFLPFRFEARATSTGQSARWSLGMLLAGVPIGKFNEHTGPVELLVLMAVAGLSYRRRGWRDLAWQCSALVGVLIGYLYLFFAPGLRVRVGSTPGKGVVDTLIDRGVLENLELLNKFCGYMGPMLLAVGLAVVVSSLLRRDDERGPVVRPQLMAAYIVPAALMVGLSLASPRSHYRLFMAPALLLVIAAVHVIDAVSQSPRVRLALSAPWLVVHLVFMGVLLDFYREVHEDETARVALLSSAPPGGTVTIPRLRHWKSSPLFYGDTVVAGTHQRARMRNYYRLQKVTVAGGGASEARKGKGKGKLSAKRKTPSAGN